MRVLSKRRRQERRLSFVKRGARFFVLRVLPVVAVLVVVRELWPVCADWLQSSPLFRVDKVMVSGNRFLSSRELVQIATVRPGMPLVNVRFDRSEERLELHPRIRKAEIRYVFPRAVRIRVEERTPVALMEHGELRPISVDGVVLPPVAGRVAESLPVVVPREGVPVEGSVVRDPAVLEALGFLSALEETDARLARSTSIVDVTDVRFARVYLDTLSTAMVYEIGGEWSAHLRALPAVIADLTEAEARGSVLDLRFREQIVRRDGNLGDTAEAEEGKPNKRT
jgi:cell division protein FtsQ